MSHCRHYVFCYCKPPEQPPEVPASHCERCQHHYAAHAGSNESCTIAGCDCSQYWLPEVPAPEEVWVIVRKRHEGPSLDVGETEEYARSLCNERLGDYVVRYVRAR
jgi:hypothetical protein